MKVIVTSYPKKIADDKVALIMKYIFSQLEICRLDIADGLEQLLHEKKYDLNSLLQSDPASVSGELGIEIFVTKFITDAAKRNIIK